MLFIYSRIDGRDKINDLNFEKIEKYILDKLK